MLTLLLAMLATATLVYAGFRAAQPQGAPSQEATQPEQESAGVSGWQPVVAPDPPPAPASAPASVSLDISTLADPSWVARTSSSTGIPERALTSYSGAALAAGTLFTGCHIGWNTLAAIGEVETAHGTHGGSKLGPDGVVSPAILGVPLNGKGVAAIKDTDGGALDGDTTWDRAVGPMHFIPTTWKASALDGNGDGNADLHQLDDAVLTAAAVLCDAGGDLSQPANWITAINAYNPSLDYNHKVADAATRYAEKG